MHCYRVLMYSALRWYLRLLLGLKSQKLCGLPVRRPLAPCLWWRVSTHPSEVLIGWLTSFTSMASACIALDSRTRAACNQSSYICWLSIRGQSSWNHVQARLRQPKDVVRNLIYQLRGGLLKSQQFLLLVASSLPQALPWGCCRRKAWSSPSPSCTATGVHS